MIRTLRASDVYMDMLRALPNEDKLDLISELVKSMKKAVSVKKEPKDIFARLWRWSRRYMQHQSGIREGYFAWSCKIDGSHNSDGAASDGELYFITALIFASNRWGNDTGINYKAEAQRILNCTMPREYKPERPQRQFPGMPDVSHRPRYAPNHFHARRLRPALYRPFLPYPRLL